MAGRNVQVTSQIQKRIIGSGTSDGAQEEEIKALFDMIDKDKSGSLSERVNVNKSSVNVCVLRRACLEERVFMPTIAIDPWHD